MFAGVWVVELIWLCVDCGFPGVSVWVCCLRLGFAFLVIASVCLFWTDFVACVCWFRRCELWLWFRLVFGELLADFWFIVGLLLFRLRVVCWLLRLVWRLCCTWVA